MVRWGMTVDLERCVGCYGCVAACKVENGTPKGVFWRRVLSKVEGEYPDATRTTYSIGCMHCEEPPCRDVCPTGATQKRDDGIVHVDPEMCIGCRYCMMACPYEARSYVEGDGGILTFRSTSERYYDEPTPYDEALEADPETAKNRVSGIVSKCDFCMHRVDEGRDPACVEDCPTNALIFGDLEDPDSEISRAIERREGFQLRPEAGTNPSVFLLPKVDKEPPGIDAEAVADGGDEEWP